jgi:hypothetical protein
MMTPCRRWTATQGRARKCRSGWGDAPRRQPQRRCAASAATAEMIAFVVLASSSLFPNLSPGAAYCAGASPYPGDTAGVGFGRRPFVLALEMELVVFPDPPGLKPPVFPHSAGASFI